MYLQIHRYLLNRIQYLQYKETLKSKESTCPTMSSFLSNLILFHFICQTLSTFLQTNLHLISYGLPYDTLQHTTQHTQHNTQHTTTTHITHNTTHCTQHTTHTHTTHNTQRNTLLCNITHYNTQHNALLCNTTHYNTTTDQESSSTVNQIAQHNKTQHNATHLQ